MLILRELEPYPHLTLSEVAEYHGKGIISNEDLAVKLNFSNFVRKFERENANILDFGSEIDFYKKIDIIKQTFNDYAERQQNPA
jgi:hypothetical protein